MSAVANQNWSTGGRSIHAAYEEAAPSRGNKTFEETSDERLERVEAPIDGEAAEIIEEEVARVGHAPAAGRSHALPDGTETRSVRAHGKERRFEGRAGGGNTEEDKSWAILYSVFPFANPNESVLTAKRRPDSSWSGARILLPVLLIAAVLLCHGVMGFAHQVSCGHTEPAGIPGLHHGSATDSGGTGDSPSGNDATGGMEALSYAAVVLAAFGVAFLVLLLAGRRWRELGARRSLLRWRYPPAIAQFPRGPTLSSLQIYRL